MKVKPISHGVICKSENSDCVVRALSNVTGCEYAVAHATLRRYGRVDRKGTFNRTIAKAYKESGLILEGIFGTSLAADYFESDCSAVLGKESVNRFKGMTLGKFLKNRPTGEYICISNNHAFAVVNGNLIDATALNENIRIIAVYKKV